MDERNEPDLALQPRRERRRRRLLALLLVSTIGTVGAGAFSIAIFTDSQAVGANAFTTGTSRRRRMRGPRSIRRSEDCLIDEQAADTGRGEYRAPFSLHL